MAPTLDLDFVRAQFPAFAVERLGGQGFFDNAGGSYMCGPVMERLDRFFRERKVQPYGPYEASRLGGEEMDEARQRLAAMMGVDTDELSFGPSTTQNTYVLSQAFRQWMSPGDAIIVTNQDHEANSGPWRRLADEGFEVREWQIDPQTGHLDPAKLDTLLDDKVRLVCFPHCSNVVGEINDVAAVVSRIHDAGALACVDGVSYAPHGLPDVGALGADIYLFSAYKTYGPHQGVMVIRRALAEQLPNQAHFFNGDVLYKKFTPAGPDHAQVAACAGMADYIDLLHARHFGTETDPRIRATRVHDLMRAQEIALLQPLLDYLKSKNSVRLLGPTRAEGRAPTVALTANRPGAELAEALAPHEINAGGGDFYAVRPLKALGVGEEGVLRLSFVHYTSKGDIDRLIRALDHVL
ncbi:aminotransferase class V-fold PLP-dependent enzyme [Psychromarinibacter halotolerans]|uniref:Aminotransferase class V-fold PLP-dependent enzyme n=1 Tax=Psychromarinibacter halotolerans TaxID=1775175 RepID=A0ABV7GZJ2_9RHOB|nr:aminotransferase class V-fold PLP-dependent enzyme [Psychromarinibacter halotolerans]MDF0597532.1 aminotransferase class V-fold PLP-dependent enzyme [Psychromarinibacter halotolerans]